MKFVLGVQKINIKIKKKSFKGITGKQLLDCHVTGAKAVK